MVEGYLTTAEAARELGISFTAVHARLKAGQMRGERVGARGWLIPRREVERWKEKGKLRPGPKPGSRRARDLDDPAIASQLTDPDIRRAVESRERRQ